MSTATDVPDTVDRFAELAVRLLAYESGYVGLHPPGYESGGRLAPVRRFVKKVSRRLMWWYVEPRWTVHREMTANLAGFNHAAIDLARSIAEELEELRARVADLEGLSRPLASPSHFVGVLPETQLTYDSDPMS